jgi:hypothetical protein
MPNTRATALDMKTKLQAVKQTVSKIGKQFAIKGRTVQCTLQPTQDVIEIDAKQNRADNTALFNAFVNWEVAGKITVPQDPNMLPTIHI